MLSAARRVAPVAEYLCTQVTVQLLGFASALIVARSLEKSDYAIFTLASTMTAALTVLADLGTTGALTALAARNLDDRDHTGELLATALVIRRKLGTIILPPTTPVALWLFMEHGANPLQAAALLLTIYATWMFQLELGIYIVIPRLHGRLRDLQAIDLVGAGLRVVLLWLASLQHLTSVLALTILMLPVMAQRAVARRSLPHLVSTNRNATHDSYTKLMRIVWTLIPTALFGLVQGQASVWLITAFGNTDSIADLGAITRIAVIVTPLGPLMANIAAPYFARRHQVAALKLIYFKLCLLALCSYIVVLTPVFLFPEQITSILGEQYANVATDLPLAATATAVSAMLSVMWTLNVTRGWSNNAWLQIPTTLAMQLILISFLDFTSISGVLWFAILGSIPFLLLQFWFLEAGTRAELRTLTQHHEST